MQVKLIFTWKILHLASLWKWGSIGNGLLTENALQHLWPTDKSPTEWVLIPSLFIKCNTNTSQKVDTYAWSEVHLLPVGWTGYESLWMTCKYLTEIQARTKGAFHYTKISGNLGRNINGTLQSRRKLFGKSGPPPELVLFDWSVRSDRNLPFHFQKFLFPVPLHWEVIEISVEM